ncbi:hypothetical protein [Methylobacter tundripaludum]|uniref:hypothetical protein n=1 Tax=Methylobacter tundripaludum TaxID=173365 RepID=UPI0004DF865F|nr:hypothetical protein [Methylobacter tundripaludum]
MAATYIDSCMVIGLIEGDTGQRKALKNYLAYQTVFSSELVRLEARILAIRQKRKRTFNCTMFSLPPVNLWI